MSVSSQETVFHHVGNGVTVTFAYGCQVPLAVDLSVYVDDALVTAGFTASGIGSPTGGSITFTTAPADQAAIRIERDIELERTTDYQQNGDFLTRVVNPDFDRLWMGLQQQFAGLRRALKLPKSDTTNPPDLPSAAARANNLLGFDADGNPIAVAPAAQSASALQAVLALNSGASGIGTQAAPAAAVPINLQILIRSQRLHARQFGVLGDGSDESIKVQNFFNALKVSGGVGEFTSGLAYKFSIDVSNTPNKVYLEGNGSHWIPANTDSIITCDNQAFGVTGSNVELFHAYLKTNNLANYCVKLLYSSGMNFHDCFMESAKIAALYGNVAQYTEAHNTVFASNDYDNNSYGAYFTGADGANRSNELFFDSCKFFSNKNGLGVFGGEKLRVRDCRFQDHRSGGRAGLVIDADGAGNGARAPSVSGCWFEINNSRDVDIGTVESLAYRENLHFNVNGSAETPAKTHSLRITSLFNANICDNEFVTASPPVLSAGHNNPRFTYLGNNKSADITGVTGTNPQYLYDDGDAGLSMMGHRLTGASSLSGTGTAAMNLRGSFTISGANVAGTNIFNTPEPDANYYLSAQISGHSVTAASGSIVAVAKRPDAFDVKLSTAPGIGESVTIDWVLIR